MARPQSIDDATLLDRLSAVFAAAGYDGASLSDLAEASGLKRASLYHRFPGGKEQMAEEVLALACRQLQQAVLGALTGEGAPKARLAAAVAALDSYYLGGRRPCLLNTFATAGGGAFAARIQSCFAALAEGLAALSRDAGAGNRKSRRRAERALVLLQGSLVLSRGLDDTAPFRTVLERLPDELL